MEKSVFFELLMDTAMAGEREEFERLISTNGISKLSNRDIYYLFSVIYKRHYVTLRSVGTKMHFKDIMNIIFKLKRFDVNEYLEYSKYTNGLKIQEETEKILKELIIENRNNTIDNILN